MFSLATQETSFEETEVLGTHGKFFRMRWIKQGINIQRDAVYLTTHRTPISGFNWCCSVEEGSNEKMTDSSFVRTKDVYIPKPFSLESVFTAAIWCSH